MVKKGGGAADPRSVFLSLFFARFSLSPPPPPSRAAPRRAAQASNSDRVQDDRAGRQPGNVRKTRYYLPLPPTLFLSFFLTFTVAGSPATTREVE